MRPVPNPLTSFVGRSEELAEVLRALERRRLLTLTGIGGVGKTRLAREVAQAYAADAAWVDLAPVDDQTLIGPAVARALGITEGPRSDPAAMVVDAVGDAEVLLVLDNCEHVADAVAGLLEGWLVACGRLRVLATSREPLRVPGELVHLVPPLPVVSDEGELPDAVRLFTERAWMAGGTFQLTENTAAEITALCRRLDGIPLALELAAARVRAFGISQIISGLDDALGILTAGARTSLARHRTLEQSIAWSHALLADRERVLFRRLSVFAGVFSLASAVAVGASGPIGREEALGLLAALVDKSLLQPVFQDGQARYRLLEVIRQYSRRQLEAAGETRDIKRRHAAWLAGEAERRAPLLFGRRVVELLDELENELDDIRAAAAWASAEGDHNTALRLLAAPLPLWICRHPAEGRQRIQQALRTAGQAGPDPAQPSAPRAPNAPARAPSVLARAHVAASWLGLYVFENQDSIAHARQALKLGAETGDPTVQAQAHTLLGWNALFTEPATAAPILARAEAESRAAGDHHHLAHAIAGQGFLSAHGGEADQALARLGESLQVARRAGDRVGIRRALAFSGVLFAVRGRFAEAEERFEECEQITRGLGDRYFLTQALDYVGFIALHRGDVETARARIGESLAVARHSTPIAQCRSHTMMALLHLALGEFDVAAAHAGQSLAIVAERGLNWHFSMTFGVAAEAYRRAGRPADSDRVIRAGVAQAQAVGLPWAEAAANAASDQADRLLKAIAGFAALGHAPELLRALEALAVSAGSRTPAPGDAAEIALLLGGTAANRRRLGIVPFPADAALLAEAPGQLQAALGNREFLQTAERGNSQSLDDLARRVLRMRGARTRPASGWESLTPTELRVAELAASGLRNSEVAARLIVAPGTVKTHLSHVYAKLGVRTRTELAAVCARNQQK